jgi:tetratricopeptide (TPR) repeat protein
VGLAALLVTRGPRSSHGEEESASLQFHRAYETLIQADAARDDDRSAEAIDLYQAAADAYMLLARQYPDWQPQIVAFRIAYCSNQAQGLMRYTGRDEPDPALAPPLDRPSGADTNAPAVDMDDLSTVLRVLLEEGKTDDARQMAMDAMTQDPDNADIRVWLAAIQCRSGRFEDAAYLAGSVVEDMPGNAEAHLLLAAAHAGTGRLKDAEEEVRFALDLKPDLAVAHYNLAWLLVNADPPDLENARLHYVESRRNGGTPDPALETRLEGGAESVISDH